MISILMPVYNTGDLLKKSIDSIRNQVYTDWELLAVDDGSTDDSYKVLCDYASFDDRIRPFHQENRGQAAARNVALDNAKGDYIAIIDSDDTVSPNFLSTLMTLRDSYDADMVQCGYEMGTDYIFKDKTAPHISTYSGKAFLREYFNPDIPGIGGITCIKLYSAKLWEGIRFPEGRIHEDVAVLYKLIYKAEKVVNTSEKLYYYYMSSDSTMRKKFTLKRLDWLTAFKEKLEFLEEKEEYALYNRSLQEYVGVALKLYYCLKKYMPNEKEHIDYVMGEIVKYRKLAMGVSEIGMAGKGLFAVSFVSPYVAGWVCDRMI